MRMITHHLRLAELRRKPLEQIEENLFNWFSNNTVKLNTGKCHLLLNSQEPNKLKIGDLHINNLLSEKLLGITFDCKLKLNKHIEDICQKCLKFLKVSVPELLMNYFNSKIWAFEPNKMKQLESKIFRNATKQ